MCLYNLCDHRGSYTAKGTVFGLMLCFCYPKILNDFLFESAFCKSSLMGLEPVHERRRLAQYVHLHWSS